MPLILLELTAPLSIPTWVAWVTAASAPLSAMGLAVFVWVIQGRLAEGVKEAMLARLSTIQEESKQNGLRLEQKIDLLTNQLRENVQSVGTDVKSLQSDLPTKIDSSASGIRFEVNDLKKELTDVTAAVRTMQATMQMSFQNLEKMMTLQVKAEVSQQLLVRSASTGGASGD